MLEKVKEEIKKVLDIGCEQLLFFTIDGLGSFIWRMEHDMSHGRIKSSPEIEADILMMRETQQYAVGQLSRIGVKGAQDEELRPTDVYWEWYKTWKAYINSLSDADFQKLNKLCEEGTSSELDYMRPDPKEMNRFDLIDLD